MSAEQNSILIVDDDVSICQTLSMILKRKGYVTDIAQTAADALAILDTGHRDLTILDIRLPDVEGTEFLKKLKDLYPDMAVFIISGYASVNDVTRAMDNDADAVMTKPLNPDEVLDKIAVVFERQHLIKSRRLAEEKLRNERAMFDTFLTHFPDSVYFKDRQARFVRVSGSLARVLNTDPAGMIGKTDEDFFAGELAAAKLHDDLSLMNTGTPIIQKEERDDADRWVSTTKLPWHNADGDIIGMFGISRDITRQKQTEEKLRLALKELKRRNRDVTKLLESSREILRQEAFDTTVRMLFDNCRSLIGAAAGYVAFLGENGEDRPLFLETGDMESTVAPDLPITIRGLRAEVYRNGRSIYVNDFQNRDSAQFLPKGHIRLESVLLAPLNVDGQVVGVFGFANKSGGFDDYDAALASAFGELAAISFKQHRMIDTLRASEKRFRDLFEQSNDAIFIHGEDGIINVNTMACELFGYTKEELRALKITDLIEPEARHAFDITRQLLAIKGRARYETTFVKYDGTVVPVEISSRAITRTPLVAQCVVRDITRRKRDEEALKKSEQLYRNVIDNIGIGVAVIGPDMRIMTLNNQMKTWFPFRENQSKPPCYKVLPNSPKAVPCDDCPTFQTMQDGKLHIDTITHDNDRHYRIISTPIFDMQGQVSAAVELVEDITERVEADEKKKRHAENLESLVAERTRNLEESLLETRAARDRTDAILKSIAEGIIVTDTRRRIILMNRTSETLLQVKLADVLNRPLDEVVNNNALVEYLRATMEGNIGDALTFEIDGPNYTRYLQARASAVQDESGARRGTIISFHDITRAHEIDRMKTEFISTAAHELRTPLTSILGFSEILLTHTDITGPEREKYLGYINKQSIRLTNIINDLLDISRIESGRGVELNPEPCDINEIINQVAELFIEQATGHEFRVELPGEPAPMSIDIEKIEQLLKNILSNAVKYSPGGGLITVRGALDRDAYVISVIDTGIGMTGEQVERIFEKFYRADASNTAIEGTGLGMGIAKQIVEAHGGAIEVSSSPGVGTEVFITLPLEQAE